MQAAGNVTLGVELDLQRAAADSGHGLYQARPQGGVAAGQLVAGFAHLVQRAEEDVGRLVAGTAGGDRGLGGLDSRVALGEEQLFLAGEVAEERPGADVGGRGDVGHGSAVVAAALKQVGRRVDQGPAGALSFAVTQGSGRSGRRHATQPTPSASDAKLHQLPFRIKCIYAIDAAGSPGPITGGAL